MLNPKDHDCGMTNPTIHPSTQHQGNFGAGGDASALCAYQNITLMHSLQPAWVLLALWLAVDLHKDIIQQQQHNRGERMSLATYTRGLRGAYEGLSKIGIYAGATELAKPARIQSAAH